MMRGGGGGGSSSRGLGKGTGRALERKAVRMAWRSPVRLQSSVVGRKHRRWMGDGWKASVLFILGLTMRAGGGLLC